MILATEERLAWTKFDFRTMSILSLSFGGIAEDIFYSPQHPCTKVLLSAIRSPAPYVEVHLSEPEMSPSRKNGQKKQGKSGINL